MLHCCVRYVLLYVVKH